MKFCSLLLLCYLACGCQAQYPAQPEVPPTQATLKELRWNVGNVLSMQLPSSLPDSLNGKVYLKSYSVNYFKADSSYNLEIPELRRTVDTDSTFGGSKYYLPFQDIDIEMVRLVFSPDLLHTAIIIPAKPGKSFLHRPYGPEPDRQVTAVTIGWYDRVQDKTLARCFVFWKQFLLKLSE